MKPSIVYMTDDDELQLNDNIEPLMEADPPEDKDDKTDQNKNNENKSDIKKDNTQNETDENPFEDNNNELGNTADNDSPFGDTSNEPDYSLTDIGRAYVLRQIYTSLNKLFDFAIELKSQLKKNETIDRVIEDLKQSKDLFVLLANNIDKYTDRLDSIIDAYRQLITKVTEILENLEAKVK